MQPRCQASGGSVELFQLLDDGVGSMLPALLCGLQLPPPCPWLHLEVGRRGDALEVQLFAPPHPHNPLPVPGHAQGTEVAQPAKIEPQAAEGSVASESEAPRQLPWVEQVELEEAEMLDLPSPSENAEEAQGPATVPPCPAPVLRPQLQAQDVVRAARPYMSTVKRMRPAGEAAAPYGTGQISSYGCGYKCIHC